MVRCPNCDNATEEQKCTRCGCPIPENIHAKIEDFDRLVEQASIPSLASLFKQGKAAGLIQPAADYGNT